MTGADAEVDGVWVPADVWAADETTEFWAPDEAEDDETPAGVAAEVAGELASVWTA